MAPALSIYMPRDATWSLKVPAGSESWLMSCPNIEYILIVMGRVVLTYIQPSLTTISGPSLSTCVRSAEAGTRSVSSHALAFQPMAEISKIANVVISRCMVSVSVWIFVAKVVIFAQPHNTF